MTLWFALIFGAHATSPIEKVQLAELTRVRAKVADEIQLSVYDLIDELVYGWTVDPIFESSTPVVLANVTVPVGLGTGMQALVENHLNGVVGANPSTNIQLAHCPSCTALVVHSGPEGTVVSRGFDSPDVLEKLGASSNKYALFVDIEAEGAWLVLRARVTQLNPDLPIVWSHTLSTSAATPALLRESVMMKSASEARQEYVDILHGKTPIKVPVRFALRSYAQPSEDAENPGVPPPPFVWLQSGVELSPTHAFAWTGSLILGVSYIPQAYQGLMAQARVSRLITGRARSLTHPDLYLFAGASIMTVWGPATAPFQAERVDANAVIQASTGDPPRFSFGTLQAGLDLRIGNRLGFAFFFESLPALTQSPNLGKYIGIFESQGVEVTVCF